jgi:fucose permease
LLIPFFLALIVIGLGLSGIGSVVPEISGQFGVSSAVIGRIFLFHGLGYFISIMVAGFLGDIIQKNLILRLGLLISVLGFAGIAFFPTFTPVVLCFMAMGVGLGFLDCMINPIVTTIFTKNPGTILNLIHAFYGFGSLAAPRLYAFMNERNFVWQDFYKLVTVITVIVFILFLFPFIPKSQSKMGFHDILKIFRYKAFWFMGAITMFYAGGVTTLNGWLVSYFNEKGLPVPVGAVYLSFFWLGLMTGRFLLSWITDRIGHLRMIQINALGGILFVTLSISLPISALLTPTLLFLTGFMLSTIIPTTLAYAVVNYPETASTASGWVLSTNGVGMFFFPWFGGILASITSFGTTLVLVPVLLVVMFVFQWLLAGEIKKSANCLLMMGFPHHQ